MTLRELNSKYTYMTDTSEYGRVEYWTVMEPDESGMYKGDCEDYALTVQAKVDGFSDWELWFCRMNGNGHCILRKDNSIIDNNTRRVVSVDEYLNTYKITEMKKYNWFVVFSKKAVAYVTKLIHKLAFRG